MRRSAARLCRLQPQKIMPRRFMQDRAQTLRRRIALYRRYLSEGVDAELAQLYLREIAEAEAELAKLDGEKRR